MQRDTRRARINELELGELELEPGEEMTMLLLLLLLLLLPTEVTMDGGAHGSRRASSSIMGEVATEDVEPGEPGER